jgi:hypothetical protein
MSCGVLGWGNRGQLNGPITDQFEVIHNASGTELKLDNEASVKNNPIDL